MTEWHWSPSTHMSSRTFPLITPVLKELSHLLFQWNWVQSVTTVAFLFIFNMSLNIIFSKQSMYATSPPSLGLVASSTLSCITFIRDWMFVSLQPPEFTCEDPIPQCDVIRSWEHWEMIRVRWGHMNGILVIRVLQELASPLFSAMQDYNDKSTVYNLKDDPQQNCIC